MVLMTLVSMPLVYFTLEIPKIIINEAIGGTGISRTLNGIPIDDVSYLLILSGLFLFLVFINGGIKYAMNVYRGILGERMLRRLRYQLYTRILRFPLPHFKRVSQSEIIPIVMAETEPLGGFIGESFSLPAFQGGLLITYLFFIFNQDIFLGFAATALYPFQLWLVPKLQLKVNKLARQRLLVARQLSRQIGSSVSGITEIVAHDTTHYERAVVSEQLGIIYRIRYEIYRKKFFIKFLNNFLAQMTPFFFYSVGGYFVIKGELTIGALVAVLAAYKDLVGPWNELLKYYQVKESVRVRYSQVIEQFSPANMRTEECMDADPSPDTSLSGHIISSNISYSEDTPTKLLDNANFKLNTNQHTLLLGSIGSGKDELARLLAGLLRPSSGRILVNDLDLSEQPLAVTGRRVGYVEKNAYLIAGSVRDNMVFGLKHRPQGKTKSTIKRNIDIHDALASGNSTDDRSVNWIDYKAAGVSNLDELDDRLVALSTEVMLHDDIYELGLSSTINSESNPRLVKKILQARDKVQQRILQGGIEKVIEQYDANKYNTSATVAENLLFGTPRGHTLNIEDLASDPFIMDVLNDVGLLDDLLEIGYKLADTMVELFADLPPEHEFFEQFSFISSEDLPEYQTLLLLKESLGLHILDEAKKAKFLGLTFKLIPTRHRLGLVDDTIQERLLIARYKIRTELPNELLDQIEFFDSGKYNAEATLQDNILFGKPVFGISQTETQIREMLHIIVQDLKLKEDICKVGLDFDVGIAGALLSIEQRQKIAIVRSLVKRPDVLIVNQAVSILGGNQERLVLKNIQKLVSSNCLIWVSTQAKVASEFDHILLLSGGRVLDQGSYQQLLNNKNSLLQVLESE